MNVLVTGASGFVGSHVVDRLLNAGHHVRVVVRASSSLQWLSGKPIEIVHGNLLDSTSLRDAVSGVDAVAHIAGVTASKTHAGFYEGNQLVTRTLLQAVRDYNPGLQRFVQGSSQTATGPSLDGIPVDELTPAHPITTYGKSKLAAEQEAERSREYFPVTILRLAAVYGPRDTAILTFFQAVAKGLKPLIGFHDKYVNLVHVSDVADSVLLALERDAARNQTYMIGSEQQYTWREVSGLTAGIVGKHGLTVRLPHTIVYAVAGISEVASVFQKKPSVLNWEKGRDMVQEYWTMSVAKATNELGYHQQKSLDVGIRETVAWYKEHGWL